MSAIANPVAKSPPRGAVAKPEAADAGKQAVRTMMNDAQLAAELSRCESCEEKPCRAACPCHCSPADFIRAALIGEPSDLRRAAALIMEQNPLGGVCGQVCPDTHCMAACARRGLDRPIDIPAVQAAVIERARALGVMPALPAPVSTGHRVAVVGGGPAGLGAAALLARLGHTVTLFESEPGLGGMCRCIPETRLDREMLRGDIAWLLELGAITVVVGCAVSDASALLDEGFEAVVAATGLWAPITLGIPGEERALAGIELLRDPGAARLEGKRVAVVGGGAAAYDCAETALRCGAQSVELVTLETPAEMPLTRKEMGELIQSGILISGRARLTAIEGGASGVTAIETVRVELPAGTAFHPTAVRDLPHTEATRRDIDAVIIAIGLRASLPASSDPRLVCAGDCVAGPSTVVEAVAAGKNAAEQVDALLSGRVIAPPERPATPRQRVKSSHRLPGYQAQPVPLETEFFGRTIHSPLLLSAAPPTDGLEQMRLAYAAGWAGGVMKTAFDDVPIHIPAGYMFAFDRSTYANCDNVSGHTLDRVCREVAQLVREYPDRLTIASTGGPVSGDDESDMRQWQNNTLKLESAGAMAVEYSLSCPQGGDGTEGDIVSQNAALSAKIVDWVLGAGSAEVPKLFKLTGAVTSVAAIVAAIKEVFDRYPRKKAGVTLANSFPALAFRPRPNGARGGRRWDEGVVVGASGAGILPISYLSLAKVAHLGVTVSGNGGPMDHKAIASFLALGARTVQLCTVVMKHGYGIVGDLSSGLSHLMAERGLRSVGELIGLALPEPITDFMALPAEKMVSAADREFCLQCGNCTRCPYLAVSLDGEGFPVTDPSRCIGCSICALKCFARAISMRPRTPGEAAALRED